MTNSDYPLIATKLHTPKPRRGLVRRNHLIERMNKGIRSKLTLVSAPAGFGKTTFITEWIDQTQWPVAWISLDNSDSDPVYFIKYVIAALQKIELKVGETALSLLRSPQHPPFDAIIINLIQDIEDISNEFALVLDDYHYIDKAEIHQLVALLIDHMPPQMHLVVATRVDPNLSLARLRVGNHLTEFRVSDLGFTEDETAQFINKEMKLDLSKEDIAILASRTEGWIAGLQLAALSMQGRSDIPSFINEFSGDDRHIVDYLAEEVLNLQPDEIKEFLLHTSILNRLSESLCDYVTNQQGSQRMLEALERGNLFLIPLDNKRRWYRYHHLFADLLRQRLHQRKSEMVNQLHIKASEWFNDNAFKEDAIDHALAAMNFHRAMDLIEANLMNWHDAGQTTLVKWLDKLPDELIPSKPNLGIYYVRYLFENGRQEVAERVLKKIEKLHSISLRGRIAGIKAYMASRKADLQAVVRYSSEALNHLPKKDIAWRTIVAISSGVGYSNMGDSANALKSHSEAVRTAKKSGNNYLYLVARLRFVFELKNTGRLDEAHRVCQQLLSDVKQKALSFNYAVGHVYGLWGEVLYELNELHHAAHYAETGVKLLEQWHDTGFLVWRYCCLSKILCSQNKIKNAEEINRKIEKLKRTSDLPPWIDSQIRYVKARIWMLNGNYGELANWFEEFELQPVTEPVMYREAEYHIYAKFLVIQDRYENAMKLLDLLLEKEKKGGKVLSQIETILIQAQVFKKQGKVHESTDAVKKALSLAEPGGYIRVFVDEGPLIADLLEEVLDSTDNILRAFIRRVLPEFKVRKVKNADDGLVEKLSEREMEVLMFVAAGLSNKQITEELFISLSTVKTHLRNIYGKLDVHSRTEAIVKAKKLGLLK